MSNSSQMTRRTFVAASLSLAAATSLAACGSSSGSDAATSDAATSDAATSAPADDGVIRTAEGPYATGLHHATIEVENYGTISLAMNADVAPVTVSNFANLASEGFYDGLTFHRVIEGFMIQGGDPNGDGTGGADHDIKGEFAANGFANPISHVRGTISMARANPYDSASSQFFIMHETNPSLDGNYAAFGNVTDGLDVVDAIAENTPVQDSNGTVAPADQPRILSVRMVD